MGAHAPTFIFCYSLTSVMFENPEGWWCDLYTSATSETSISSTDLADPSTAAKYLTLTYSDYNWYRK